MTALRLALGFSAVILGACSPAALPLLGPQHDQPVAESEARAEVALRVVLAASQGCEEQVDLGLYEDRAIDLVTWDPPRGACGERTLRVRYLSGRATAEQVIARVKDHVTRVDVVAAAAAAQGEQR